MKLNFCHLFLIICIFTFFSMTARRIYLRERVERLLNETKRIHFSDQIAEDRYLQCRLNACLNESRINLNQANRQKQQFFRRPKNKFERVRLS